MAAPQIQASVTSAVGAVALCCYVTNEIVARIPGSNTEESLSYRNSGN